MTLVVDHSGKVHTRKMVTIKDVIVNREALLAVIRGSQGNPRLSIVTLKRAILAFYTQYRLFPTGVVSELDSVQDWADKCAKALL
ncbi:unnamed protein product, partial [Cladocopium goreaui]